MTHKELVSEIKHLRECGINSIPVWFGDKDGKRIVALHTWERYKMEIITDKEAYILSGQKPHNGEIPNGIAVVTGAISGNLRMVDVDLKNRDSEDITIDYILQAAKSNLDDIFDKLVVESTKNGGLHFFYRSENEPEQTNIMLARSVEGKELINEFTGPHLGFTSPSEGYTILQGSWEDLEVLTEDEISILHIFCRSFNNYTDKKEEPTEQKGPKKSASGNWEVLPGVMYNDSVDPYDYLISQGWTEHQQLRNGDIVMTKPGTEHTSNRSAVYEVSKGKVWVLTTSVPELKQFNSYDSFGLFTAIECGGDFKKAAQKLFEQGFGIKRKKAEKREENDAFDVFHNVLVSDAGLVKNEITLEIEQDGNIMTEQRLNNYLVEIMRSGKKIKRLSQSNFKLYINSEQIPMVNPLKEFFESQKCTTGGSEIKKLLRVIKPYNEFVMSCFKKWLVGIVANVYQNKYPNILTPILYGPTNTGKTSFFRQLLPDELKNYFSQTDGKDFKDKDEKSKMCQNLLWFFDELDFEDSKQARQFRAFVSADKYDYRAPYASKSQKYNRLASACATSNYDDFITESEHNRRMIPIFVQEIDFDLFNSIDKVQLFRELYDIYRNSSDNEKTWTLEKGEAIELSQMSAQNEPATVEEETIVKYLEPFTGQGAEKMTASEILKYLEDYMPKAFVNVRTIGKTLKKLNFISNRERTPSGVRNVYSVRKKTEDEWSMQFAAYREDNIVVIDEDKPPF